jgi:hypothetical protein
MSVSQHDDDSQTAKTRSRKRRGRRLGLIAALGGAAALAAACVPIKPPPPPPPPPSEALLEITPTSESFTDEFPDPGAQTKQFTVTNVGGQPTGVLSDVVVSDTAEFSFADPDPTSCDGVTLAPGASCTTSVQFTAGDASGSANGQFIVKATPGGAVSANLSGTRTPTPVPVSPAIKVIPTSVFLFAPGAFTDSPPVEVTILNQGAGDASNVQLAVSTTSGQGIQEVSRTCGANGSALAASTSCSITVKWSPDLTPTAQGHLSISGDNFQTIIVPIFASLD